MGTNRSPGFLFAVVAALASCPALAQHAPAAISPYTLSMSVTRAPLAASCPGTALHCAREPGLNVSLVGRAAVSSSFGLFGKVGTTSSARPETSVMGTAAAASPRPEPGSALSWGGGVSYDFTPRLSAAFEWVSYDLRAAGGVLRTTNLGLKYRY